MTLTRMPGLTVAPNGARHGKFDHPAVCTGPRGTLMQHIPYGLTEPDRLCDLVHRGVVPDENLDLLFVLGRYGSDRTALVGLLCRLQADSPWDQAEWSVCAFARMETQALAALRLRLGLEQKININYVIDKKS